jgi:hypothetical protein
MRVYGRLIGHTRQISMFSMPNGHREICEVKGFETIDFKLRRKIFEPMMEHDHPKVDLVIIK